jgi:hypothetical protein
MQQRVQELVTTRRETSARALILLGAKAEEAEPAAGARVVRRPRPVPDDTTTEAGDFPAAA